MIDEHLIYAVVLAGPAPSPDGSGYRHRPFGCCSRAETLRAASLALISHHSTLPLAAIFGSGTLSSSDGQRFHTRQVANFRTQPLRRPMPGWPRSVPAGEGARRFAGRGPLVAVADHPPSGGRYRPCSPSLRTASGRGAV
ncbi:Tn3 family transposase [Streptosporangiaceae bacterium NEAU-GS5]|nr:Tn3 family transposase [Streptosporangiaceae bacterium NEAU-GS5]